jgi:LuxR family maltose regulon positive regulatory protein
MEKAHQYFSAALKHQYIMHRAQAMNCLAGLAMTQQAMGQTDEAHATANQLAQFAIEMSDPNGLVISRSAKARLSLIQGNPEPGMELVRIFNEPLHSSSFFLWLELPHVTCCRALIATGTKDGLVDACERLERLLEAADAIHNIFHKIDLLVLKGLAFYMLSRIQEALKTLEQAINLAMPGGWIRPFVEPGSSMPDMIFQLKKRNVSADFIDKILTAFPTRPSRGSSRRSAEREVESPHPLIEPLTHRELDVLDLLSERLQNKEIAEKLFISPTTVKTHLKNIFQKLNVGNRRQAVETAKRLNII